MESAASPRCPRIRTGPATATRPCSAWLLLASTPDVLSVSDRDTEKEEHEVQEGQPLSSPAATDATMADEEANEAVSVHSSSSESPTIPSTEQPEEDDVHMEDDDSANTSSADEDDALAIVRPLPKHVQHKTKCWKQKMKQGACYPHRTGNPQVAAPHRTSLSPLSNEDRGLRPVQGQPSLHRRPSPYK